MAKETDREIKLPSLDELFSSQEERDDAKLRKIEEIPLDKIDSFPEHPYKVRDDDDMMNLVESVKANGVITPATLRKKWDGRYEIISGHRRKRACELAGFKTLRSEVVEMNRNEAIVFMVESNFQRSKILPSEKGFAYKMRLEAVMRERKRIQDEARKRGEPLSNEQIRAMMPLGKDYIREDSGAAPGKVRDILLPHNANTNVDLRGHNDHVDNWQRSRDILSSECGDSARTIQRYIRLTNLIEPLRDLVDDGEMGLLPAVELSYLTSNEQYKVNELIDMEQSTPSHAQTIRMRKLSNEGKLTKEAIENIMLEVKPNQKPRIILKDDKVRKWLPKNLPVSQTEEYICKCVEYCSRNKVIVQARSNKSRDMER